MAASIADFRLRFSEFSEQVDYSDEKNTIVLR